MFDIKKEKKFFLAVITVILLSSVSSFGLAYAPSADVFAGQATCPEEEKGVFASQSDVYIFGTGLTDGDYYVKVTTTGGVDLGTSGVTVVPVLGGELACIQLNTIVNKISDSTPGWDESTQNINYKIRISTDPDFPPGQFLESDVFKVNAATPPPPGTATITLVKIVDNIYGGNEGENDFGLRVGGNVVLSGVIVPVTPGVPISISEDGIPGAYEFVGISGTGCPTTLPDSVTLASGQDLTCEITNRDIQPTITLTKVADSNWETKDPNDFLLTIDGSPATSGTSYPVNSNTVIPIGETQQYGYVLDSVTGDGCPAKEDFTGTPLSASVTLDEGEDLSCTITNKDIRGELKVRKFYDLNANGLYDDPTIPDIEGWKVNVDGTDQFTTFLGLFLPGPITVYEYLPIQLNWIATTPTTFTPIVVTDERVNVKFGNLCLGPGGGHTLGFWSNKNGQATMNDGGTLAPELALLSGLNLRNGAGADFDPATYSIFRTWLLSATATNMSYMLSAQLAAMELSVEAGNVSDSSLVYAPGLLPFAPITGLSATGFISVNDLMTAANNALGADGYTPAGDSNRAFQGALKNALDAANNNKNFVQTTPCAFSFAE